MPNFRYQVIDAAGKKSEGIIEAAKEQIGTEDKKFEDLLADLERSRKVIESERLEIAEYKKEVEELKKKLEEKTDKLDRQREEILREANEQARDILQEAKNVADETIRVFRKAGPGASMQDLERARTGVGQKISDKNKAISVKKEKAKETHPILKESQLKLGESVKIVSMGLKGTISSKPDKDGNLYVQCGIMRTKTNIRDLVLVKEDDGKAAMKKFYGRASGSSKMDLSRAANIKTEVNLIGKNSDDAIAALDKYLDDAYMSHLNNVRVVHGKGAGILRQAVHAHLKSVPYVKSFKLGEFGEGDAGVTIVTFIK